MSGMSGGSMLRTRRKDVNVKPNRKLDRKSSRGMLYENEELRLRTININAEVERGQSDIKKLKRENEQLKREISSLRYEYDKLDKLLRERVGNRSSEGSEDSESCCSDCEEKACKQNDVNAVHDENSCNSRAGGAAGSLHVAFNSLMVVPEEAVGSEDASRDANVDTEDLDENRDCDCEECSGEQIINSELSYPSTSKAISSQYCDTILPYESPTPSVIFSTPTIPKRELDILINNNNIYTGDASLPGPPIGFVIPDRDQFNIFENMPHSQVISYNPNTNKRFQTGGNVEDLLGDIQSSNSNNRNLVRDAIVMYNTRKVIQQQTITNSDLEVENKPEVNTIIRSDRNDGRTYYVTEKKLDLDYDYPKMANIPESSSAWLEPRREPTNAENTVKQCKTTTTQTTLTTTEINSTVVMIDRKKLQPKNKTSFFSRSQSAPVEPIVEEPIYATVKKLPKKLRMVDVSNLEDEVSYNPEVLASEDVKSESIELSKDESASLSSSQHEVVPEPRKSSMKKKRFSIYFKRKSKMTDSKKKKPAEVVSSKRNQTNEGEKPSEEVVDNAASERLIAGASDSDTQIKGCQKHGKSKRVDSIPSNRSGGSGQGRNTPPNGHVCGEHRKTHKCSRRKKSIRSESGAKHKYSPMRNYFKQDSYQEMTTSHSERERTNSLSSSAASGFSVGTHKSRKISVSHPDGNIPWCGCWGNSCL